MSPRIKEQRVLIEDQGAELLLGQLSGKEVTKIIGNALGLTGLGGPQEFLNDSGA